MRYANGARFYGPAYQALGKIRPVVVAAAVLCTAAVAASSAAHPRLAMTASWRPAERCAGSISGADAKNDTRSWTLPAPAGPARAPASADLRRFDLRATPAGVCVRWTTGASAPPGTVLVLAAHSPYMRQPGGGTVASAYGFELELRKNDARATYGLDRIGSSAPHVLRARVGRTGSIVSAFVSQAELSRPPANMPNRPPFPYRAFSFEARVLSVPDSSGNRRVDFWPQERSGVAADIDGRLCAAPCQDPRFNS